MLGKLAIMGMIAGTPAIFGAWIGGFAYSCILLVFWSSLVQDEL